MEVTLKGCVTLFIISCDVNIENENSVKFCNQIQKSRTTKMIRSVSHICRQWGFTKLTNQQTNHVVNTENLARIFCQPNLTFYSSASLHSDTVEDSNEGSSEVKLLLDQLEASHPGKLNASKACSMMYALAQSAPKDVFKAYFNDAGSIGSAEKYPLVTTIVKLLENRQIDQAHTKELVSFLCSS